MANSDYLHGSYGSIGDTHAQSALQTGSFAAAVGTAPIHLVRDFDKLGLVNRPLKLTSKNTAQATIGYAADWKSFTLCEATHLFFDSTGTAVSPLVVVNVLDPTKHKKAEKQTQTLTFVNGRAEFVSSSIILDTFGIDEKAEGVDYSLDYDYTAGKVIVKDLTGEGGTVSATYEEVDPSQVTVEDIVGGKTEGGEYTGVEALELLYLDDNTTPSTLAAPGWSHDVKVRNALVAKAQRMGGKFFGMAYTDIPCGDVPEVGCDTIAKAKAYKEEKNFSSEFEVTCWPMAQDNEGNVYHGSTLSIYRQQLVDNTHDGVPFETCSNKDIPCAKQYFGAESKNAGFTEEEGNDLNSVGIRTIIKRNGALILWGGHTSAYKFGSTSDAKVVFESSMRMLGYCSNKFVRDTGIETDNPIGRTRKDALLQSFQDVLDGYAKQEACIGHPVISFEGEDNPRTNLVNGDFKFTIDMTPTPQFKSSTVVVHYSDAGFDTFFE